LYKTITIAKNMATGSLLVIHLYNRRVGSRLVLHETFRSPNEYALAASIILVAKKYIQVKMNKFIKDVLLKCLNCFLNKRI
jgi:hypothetical protein